MTAKHDEQADAIDAAQARESIADQGDRAVSLTQLAIDHFKLVLSDPDATDTAKTNAANGLAQIERQMDKALKGSIHRLDRSEILAEIARIRQMLALAE